METYNLKNDVNVFGVQVKSFPNGVGEAFHDLIKLFPADDKRSYYGIFSMAENGNMVYYAAAEETYQGEAEKYKCERRTIEKGEYLTEPIHDWRKNTDCIKDVFMKMSTDERVDHTKPGVEWYKNDDEMLCMLKAIPAKINA
jgi:predicted transcriptional regulator YdeE